jgi:hypothetical protein
MTCRDGIILAYRIANKTDHDKEAIYYPGDHFPVGVVL